MSLHNQFPWINGNNNTIEVRQQQKLSEVYVRLYKHDEEHMIEKIAPSGTLEYLRVEYK